MMTVMKATCMQILYIMHMLPLIDKNSRLAWQNCVNIKLFHAVLFFQLKCSCASLKFLSPQKSELSILKDATTMEALSLPASSLHVNLCSCHGNLTYIYQANFLLIDNVHEAE